MAYVVVVFSIINSAALLAVAWFLWLTLRDLPTYVETAIADEVRKQDDRIEKRAARAQGPDSTGADPAGTLATDGLMPGRPVRR